MIKIASGQININPQVYCEMGCGPTRNKTKKVLDDLVASYLIVKDELNLVLLIALDLLYVGTSLKNKITTQLNDIFKTDQIIFCASHTHYAPMTDHTKPKLGEVNNQYIRYLVNNISTSVRNTYKSLVPLTAIECLEYNTSLTQNRRKKKLITIEEKQIRFNRVISAPGKHKKNIKAHLIFFKSDKNIIASAWQYPCHPTSYPREDGFTSHFPGVIREHIQNLTRSAAPILFLQGFSGDLRPPSTEKIFRLRKIKEIVLLVINGLSYTNFSYSKYLKWCGGLKDEINRAYRDKRPEILTQNYLDKIDFKSIQIDLSKILELKKPRKDFFEVQKLSFDKISLLAVSAEVVSDYVSICNLISDDVIIPIGCTNSTFGYMPTQKMIKEGGYEAKNYLESFNILNLKPDIVEVFKKALNEIFN